MGVMSEVALGAVRLSLGRDNTSAEIEVASRDRVDAYGKTKKVDQ
jgi:cysteine sulfinate desulfinase/cysteine desulfurase-like protein